jgi:hypothetical protein
MKRNRKTAWTLAAVCVMASVCAAAIIVVYLPQHGERVALAMGALIAGLAAAAVVAFLVSRLPDSRVVRVAACALVALLILSPVISAAWHRVSFARFGLTVYGVVPVPFLDITVNRHGLLWFRAKTHLITREEVARLLAPDVEVVVIGIGWDSIARVADDAMALASDVEVRVLPTRVAFALYNSLVAQGRRAVLLAHSTC